jgi:hypothetical protein
MKNMVLNKCFIPNDIVMRKLYPTVNAAHAEKLDHKYISNTSSITRGIKFLLNIDTAYGIKENSFDDVKNSTFAKSDECVEFDVIFKLSDIIPDDKMRRCYIMKYPPDLDHPYEYLNRIINSYSFDIFKFAYDYVDSKYSVIDRICVYNSIKYDTKVTDQVLQISDGIESLRKKYRTQTDDLSLQTTSTLKKCYDTLIQSESKIKELLEEKDSYNIQIDNYLQLIFNLKTEYNISDEYLKSEMMKLNIYDDDFEDDD